MKPSKLIPIICILALSAITAVAADPADDTTTAQNNQRVADAEAAVNDDNATDADRLELANAYFEASRYRDAAKIYAKLSNADYDTRLRHARALSWSGNLDAAESRYAALMRERSTPELELEYGRLLSWMGASRASIDRLGRLHAASPTEDSAIALANAHTWSGHRDEGIRVLSEFTAAHPDATKASELLSEVQSSPDVRIEKLDRLIAADEFNLALRVERARLLHEGGHYHRALRDIEFVHEHAAGQDVPDLTELERNARARRGEEIAKLDERRRTMMSAPMTSAGAGAAARAEEERALAKAYTGLGAYDQAIDLYESYLDTVPDDTTTRLRYARVLSWDSRYDEAQTQFEIVMRELPDRDDIRLEYAQALAYDGEYVPAVSTLRSMTSSSSEPARADLYPQVKQQAHFNLGQIYRWYGWRNHAVAEQNSALALDSTFGDAQRELELARLGLPGSSLRARFTQENNSNDFHTRRADLEAEHWLNPRLAVQGAIGRHNFDQDNFSANSNVASAGASFRQTDQLTLRARVGANFWDHGAGVRPFFGAGATYLPNIQTRLALDYNRYDLVYDVSNLFTLADGLTPGDDVLSINDFRAHADYDTGGRISMLGDASYGFISDDNKRVAAHGLVSFRVFDTPFVAIKADGRLLSYDFRSNRYWSPDDYSSLAGVLQVGQDIRDRVFWSLELKAGRAWEGDRSSDLRAYGARVTVPVGDRFDIIGAYNYGRSGRFDSLIGDPEFTNYWQRSWYVGVRVNRLYGKDDRRGRDRYYYDNRVLGSDIIPPEVR